MTTATLGQIIDALTELAASEGRDKLVVLSDEDTSWILEIDPHDFIAPNKYDDGEIVLRSIGYYGRVGERRGDCLFD